MASNIPKELFAGLSALIQSKIGLYFPEERWHDLERGVRAAALELGFEDAGSCIRGLLDSPVTKVQIDTLVAHLTVGETFFLRDESHFNALLERIFPDLMGSSLAGRQGLRLWSAACCTGEEPYTLAMMIEKANPLWREDSFSILATDINSRFLEKARRGVYTNWSLRNAPKWMVEKYFTMQGKNRFEISPHLKKGLRFTNLNLVDPVYPSAVTHTENVDIIFCRNVLMYFSNELREKVIDRLAWALSDDGWLFVGPSEAAFVNHPNLRHVRFPGAMLFQKQSAKNQGCGMDPLPEAEQVNDSHEPALDIPAPALTSTVKDETPGDELYEEALGLVEQGDYKGAVLRLKIILSRADKSTGIAPDARAMALLARTYANMGKLENACKWCKKAVDVDKINPGHRYLLASIYEEMGEPVRAGELLQSALFLDSRFVLAHFALANVIKKQGRIHDAKKHYKNALSLLIDLDSEAVIPHSGGMAAGRLTQIVRSMILED